MPGPSAFFAALSADKSFSSALSAYSSSARKTFAALHSSSSSATKALAALPKQLAATKAVAAVSKSLSQNKAIAAFIKSATTNHYYILVSKSLRQSDPNVVIGTCLALIVATLFLWRVIAFLRRDHLPVNGKTILITGASEGMGLSVARKLAAKGANIVLVSRNPKRLEVALRSVTAAAKDPSRQRFHAISADVSVPSYAAPVVAEAKRWNGGRAPDIVWCVAGTSVPSLFADMAMESMRYQMNVNFYGIAEMSHAILREWLALDAPVESEPKHLIMTASVVAFYTIPGYAPYAPSKWAIRGLADTLSQEVMMYPQKVNLHVVFPGTILSPGYDRENRSKPEITSLLEKSDPRQEPDKAADQAIRGLQRGHYFVTLTLLGSLMKWGMLGGSFRNNWLLDTLGAWAASFIWFFAQMDLHGTIRRYGRNHGHPAAYKKRRL